MRTRVSSKVAVPVTSSDNNRAFWMGLSNKDVPKRPYYRFFGEKVYIKESEIDSYIAHNCPVYFE